MPKTPTSLAARHPAARTWFDDIRLPLGNRKVDVLLVSDGEALVAAYFGPIHPDPSNLPANWIHDSRPLAEATAQLEAYAAGDLTNFDVALRPLGTQFQLDVWAALSRIPFGTTTTYGRLASEVGRPTGSRAVGAAVGRNPIGIIIPCHRVIGADGSLTGYAGGLDNKRALLQLEGIAAF